MNTKKYIRKEIKLGNFIESYKNDLTDHLVNKNGVTEKIYIINSTNDEIIEEINLESLSENIEKKDIELYLPITTAIYDDMVIINGDEVDLNDGLEVEYVEGLTYMPTSGRMIDIGELNVSIYRRVALILLIKAEEVTISVAEGKVDKDLNLTQFKLINNAGIVSIEIGKYLSEKLSK